ncbi:MAG: AsmA-like C-terminal region-containing protein [Rhizobiaceae bacterium]
MKEPVPKHEKIRFRKRDVAGWHAYPSATGASLPARPRLVPRWVTQSLKWLAFGSVALIVGIVALLVVIPSSGIESEWLRAEAERAVARLTGDRMDARIGRTTLALDRRYFLAIGIDDLAVAEPGSDIQLARAGRLGFGVRFWPLLAGRVEIGSATLSDAHIAVPAGIAAPGKATALTGPDGLIDPDKLVDAVFAGFDQLVARVGPLGIETVRMRNVELTVGGSGPDGMPITIVDAQLSHTGGGGIEITGQLAAFDHSISLSGEGLSAGGETAQFSVEATVADNGKTYELGGKRPEARSFVHFGEISLKVDGRASDNLGPASITVTASAAESDVTVGLNPELQASATAVAKLTRGAGALWIDRLELNAARSKLAFSGLVTPQPETGDGENGPTYAFRVIGPQINISPVGSPEPALAAIARLGGWISRDGRRIVASEINVATGQGEVIGSGAMEIVAGKSPGISLAIAVAQMPVSHAKNLWPFFAAPGARRWALANVFGGRVENSRLLLRVEPGRLGDGTPLNADEVSGHFEISDTRFDVAGAIPPMRDAIGTIDFAGTDVDIALKSGTVFTESGRTLDARNGTLVINDAHIKPLIGEVDIEIDGAAAAVTEVAGYNPINLSRYLPISPNGISGTAKGRVLASVPLQDDIAAEDLDWHLELNYEGLSLAEPYEGQRIEDAKGTIVADPDRADFVAEARLNGIRGELTLSEPLGADKSTRKRQARLFLEPGDADKLFDGLSAMVTGPLTIDVEQLGPGREKVHVDLSRASLTLPWIGWAKDKGVSAVADFVMNRDGETTELTGFKLAGDGFGGSGSLTVDERGLLNARFGALAFGPGDNIAMGIDRAGKSYKISVSGQTLDARFLIKEFGSVLSGPAAGGGEGGSTSVNVNAEVSEVTGFGGETLVGAKLAYSDSTSKVPGIRVSASTPQGARATIVDASASGSRKVEVKADDAGALLRFLDIYDKLGGGRAALSLAGASGSPLRGRLEMREFTLIEETRLQSMVSRAPPGAERSLNDAVKRDVDVSRARFERGSASIEMGKDYLTVADGVVSGPSVGSTFQGTVFDANGNMAISGTFLPAYGINRLFGEIPLLGQVLGNGRGGGLIGITYRLYGPAGSPQLEVNPLSIVAPGIFRSIFEYR